jgi:hypothetical protein
VCDPRILGCSYRNLTHKLTHWCGVIRILAVMQIWSHVSNAYLSIRPQLVRVPVRWSDDPRVRK